MKAAVVAIDIHDATLQKARRFGTADVINSANVNSVEAVHELVPHGIDSVFDFVGLKEVTTQALEMLTVGGALYLIGVSSRTRRSRSTLSAPCCGSPASSG